jgi:hypothetical protein
VSEEVKSYKALLLHTIEALFEIENNTRQLREKVIVELLETLKHELSDEAR